MKIISVLKTNPIISLAAFSALIFIFFNYILAKAVETIDPCSATPGQEFNWVAILVPFFFLLLWFYLKKTTSSYIPIYHNIYVFVTLFVIPIISFFLVFIFFSNTSVQNGFLDINHKYSIYEIGCYGELEITLHYLCGLSAFFVFFISLIVFKFFATKNSNVN